jgi:hypothetical protein
MANILDKTELLTLTDGIAFYATVGGVDYYILQSTLKAPLETHIADNSNPHSVSKSQVGLGDVPNTDFTSAVAANTAKNSYPTADANKVANVPSDTNAELALKFNLSELDVTDLGTNPTAWDMSSRYLAVAKAILTSGVTIAISNDSNVRNISLWIDLTNNINIVLSGFDFLGTLPDGVTWTKNTSTLSFSSADGEYQILGEKNPLTSGLIVCNIQKVAS